MICVAAFEPFGKRRRNRAEEAALLLRGHVIGPEEIVVARLSTRFAALPDELGALLDPPPSILLLVGESHQTRHLLVERVALNLGHARIPDNAGAQPIDEHLVTGATLARGVRFDARVAANAMLAAGVPSEVSAHAGTFCCNAALYHALGLVEERRLPTLVAFVHVPARWPWARRPAA